MHGTVIFAMGLNLLIGIGTRILMKLSADQLPKAKALGLQYFCSMVLAWIIVFFSRKIMFQPEFLWIALAGGITAIGAYFQWQAYSINLSKTTVLAPLGDIVTLVLAALFLGEIALYQNIFVLGGVLLLLCSSFLFTYHGNKSQERVEMKWLGATLLMVFIFGIGTFVVKLFSFTVPTSTFLSYWYGGGLLGSLVVLIFRREPTQPLFQKGVWKVPLLSIGILGSLATFHWAFQYAPAGLVVPIITFFLTLLTIFSGLFIFRERRRLRRAEYLGFGIGTIGITLLVAFAF